MGVFRFPSKEAVERLREEYPQGTRVMLQKMDDPYTKLKPGDRGTVTHVDDAGTVFCRWDSGSGLGLAWNEDDYRKLTPEELAEEQANSEEMTEPEQENGGMEMGM